MNLPIRNVALPLALMTLCVALSGCGNKGPLVRASDVPPPPAAVAPAAEQPASDATSEEPETSSGTPAARS
ncbi:MAG: lipoprotein [Thermomonas sp.]